MQLSKKIISIILAFFLTFPFMPTFAFAETESEQAQTSVESNSSSDADQDQDLNNAQDTNEPQSEDVSGSSNSRDEDSLVQGVNPDQPDTTSEGTQTYSDTEAFEFIYIDQKEVTLNSEQNIVVSFINKENASSSELYFQKEGGEIQVLKPSQVEDGAALFKLSFTSEDQLGTYKLIKATWGGESSGEANISIDSDSGYSFSVIKELSNTDDPLTIYSIDDNGQITEEDNLEEAIEESEGDSQTNGASLLTRSSSSSATSRSSNSMVIALDPGHGGSDPGAVNGSLIEKDLNLKIATYCKEALEQYSNVEVYMTRTTDEYVGLTERVTRAVDAGADVFVSFHINSTAGATGFEVWIQNDSSWRYYLHEESSALGTSILDKLDKFGLKNRGNKQDDAYTYPDGSSGDYLAVLRESRYNDLPAVLVEHGFINGSLADQQLLSNESSLKAMGEADAEGIAEYYGLSSGPQPYIQKIDNNGNLTLAWDPVDGAEKYAISIYKDGKYSIYATECKDTFYTISNLTIGENCEFLVQSYVNGKWSTDSASARTEIRIIPTPEVTTELSGDGQVTLSWAAVPGATNYAVAEYVDGKYTILTSTLSSDTTSYTVSNLGNGYEHQFLVQAKVGGYWSSDNTSLLVSATPQGTTKPSNIQATGTKNSIELSWGAVPGATKYAVSTKNADGTYNIRTTSVTGTSCTLTGLTNGVEYPVLVQAYVCGHWSAYTDSDLVYATPQGNPVMGNSDTTVEQMMAYYTDASPISYPSSIYASYGAPTLRDFCQLVYCAAQKEGVRAEVLFCQAMKETGWLQFGGDVQPAQCNFGGLGAVGGGAIGASFPNVETGLLAQAQHLKAYASTEPLNEICVDPRFNLVTRGSAPYVEWLGQQENPYGLGWATTKNYGVDIVKMMDKLISY